MCRGHNLKIVSLEPFFVCLLNLSFSRFVTPGCNYVVAETGVYISLVFWFNCLKHRQLERRDVMTEGVSFSCDYHRRCVTPEQLRDLSFKGQRLVGSKRVVFLWRDLACVCTCGHSLCKLVNLVGKQKSRGQKES